jgi:hypothetical protein
MAESENLKLTRSGVFIKFLLEKRSSMSEWTLPWHNNLNQNKEKEYYEKE